MSLIQAYAWYHWCKCLKPRLRYYSARRARTASTQSRCLCNTIPDRKPYIFLHYVYTFRTTFYCRAYVYRTLYAKVIIDNVSRDRFHICLKMSDRHLSCARLQHIRFTVNLSVSGTSLALTLSYNYRSSFSQPGALSIKYGSILRLTFSDLSILLYNERRWLIDKVFHSTNKEKSKIIKDSIVEEGW